MGEQTKIAWTDATFNPWIGCTKVHLGCKHCFAEKDNNFHKWNGGAWGPGAPRKVTSPSNWKKPLGWARAAAKVGERRKVFCGSLCDVLDEEAPPEVLERLWDLIRATARLCAVTLKPVDACGECEQELDGGLTWLLLSKRPERWAIIPADVRPLVWLGTSASDQPTWDEWVGRLVKAEGFARLFVSLEPLVGPVDGSKLLGYCHHCDKQGVIIRADGTHAGCERPVVSWVICGGESGPKARPCDLAWIRAIVARCQVAGVAPFVKQVGRIPVDGPATACAECGPNVAIDEDGCCAHCGQDAELHPERILRLKDSHGGNPSEWPEPFPRELPKVLS